MAYANVKVNTEQGGEALNIEDGAVINFGDSNDAVLSWNTTSTDRLKLTAAANNTRFDIGTAALSFDVYLYGSASTVTFDASANTLDFDGLDFNLNDDDILAFGDSNDVTLEWDTAGTDDFLMSAAANNTPVTIGSAAKSFDLTIYSSVGTIAFDASANDLDFNAVTVSLNDDDELNLGDSNDAVLSWATTSTDRLLLAAGANNARFDIGTSTASWDIIIDGTTGTITFDASANDLNLDGVTLSLNDDDEVNLGDSNDAVLSWATASTDRLLLAAGANNARWDVGTSTASWDIIVDGSAGTMTFDASADTLDLDAIKLDINNSTSNVQFYLAAALSTANVGPGGFRMYTNSTTAILAVNTTGTTWKTMALH